MVTTLPLPTGITEHLPELTALCREFGVARLEVFGSVMTDKFNPETSDIDFVVEFLPDTDPGPWLSTFQNLNRRLEELFQRDVDLIFLSGIRNPVFKRNIASTRQIVYGS